jgi:serine/threonine protein kinase
VVEGVQVVSRIDDANFEERPAKCHEREWPWKFHGRLLILSVPYHPGRHYATSLAEYVPLVEKLKALHEAGYVHGDIRCFNIVFSEEDSHFIDFDLGGKTDDNGDGPPYPLGYAFTLRDGIRRGTVGEAIRDVHDWSALVSAFFYIHWIDPPGGVKADLANLVTRLQVRIPGELCTKPETKDATIKELEELLAEGKKETGWQINASDQLQAALKEAGFGDPTPDGHARKASANVSANATGSPEKGVGNAG